MSKWRYSEWINTILFYLRKVPKVVKFIDRKYNGACQGSEKVRKNRNLLFDVYRVSIWEEGKVLETHGSDGYITLPMYLTPRV